jgi:sugar phosphate isomerase/epimerase
MSQPLRLSCADFTFPLLAHEDVFRLIRLLGVEAVDVGLFSERSHLQPDQILHNAGPAGKKLKRQLQEHGLLPADVFVQLGREPSHRAVNDPDIRVRRENRDRFGAAVEFAHAAGCHHLTGLPGVPLEGQNSADGLALAVEETVWRLGVAREAGIIYGVEAHLGSNCPTPEKALSFIDRVPGLTLTLDYGHFVYHGQPAEVGDCLLPQASHFHARSGAKGHLQVRFPLNQIDFRPMVRHCLTSLKLPWICLEYVWIDWEGCNEVDTLSETILLKKHLQDLAIQCDKG